jgi:hypothetical protein
MPDGSEAGLVNEAIKRLQSSIRPVAGLASRKQPVTALELRPMTKPSGGRWLRDGCGNA